MGQFLKNGHLFVMKSITVAFLFIAFLSCENDPVKVNEISYIDTLPVQTGRNIEVIYSDSGKIQVTRVKTQASIRAVQQPADQAVSRN